MFQGKKRYVSPLTQHARMELEQGLCVAASYVIKEQAMDNAEVSISQQKGFEDQTEYEYDTFDSATD